MHTLDNILEIIKTMLICFIMVSISLLFNKDLNNYVFIPLENIIEKIDKISIDPFKS